MLRTLGTAELYHGETGELLLGPGKQLALLTYLALTPGRRTSRETLLDLLWADLDPDRARSALRQSLFHLRRLLGDDALPGAAELLLARPIDTDRDRFLTALEAGDLEAALACYGGPFLPAFGVPGGAGFEQWADLERDRLRAAFLRCGEIQVRRYLNNSRFREAHRLARRLRDEAPGTEAAWRLLLEAVTAGGDLVAAAVEGEALERWADREGVPLEPATQQAIARARQLVPSVDSVPNESGLVAELTGREREFSMITTAWDAARHGGFRHLHLTAPAGLGKTRLLRDAVTRLRAGGSPVVELRASPGDRDIPYAFAGDLAMALAGLPGAKGIAPASASALVSLNPALSSRMSGSADAATGEVAFLRRMHALADLVQAVADEAPFVLVVDDLHWVDPRSYRLLEATLERVGGARLLGLTAARPDRMPGGDAVTVIPLAPLTAAQVSSLVTTLGTIPDGAAWGPDLLRGMYRATRGSPLLVLETLRLAMDHGALTLHDGSWDCADPTHLSAVLRTGEAMRSRIRALPEGQRWVLALLATAGTALLAKVLADADGRGGDVLEADLGALERLGLVRREAGGDGWLPAHDEIAAAARESLEPPQSRAAEQAIGMVLSSAGADPARRLRALHHLVAARHEPEVRRQFRGYVRCVRDRGDRRPLRELAAEVLQEGERSAHARALTASLPPAWRVGLWSPVRQLVAGLALLVIGAGVGTGLRGRGADVVGLQRLVYADTAGTARAARIGSGNWAPNALILPSEARSEVTGPAKAFLDLPPALSPDGRTIAWIQDAGDSTTLDIWLRTGSRSRRLTQAPRDDLVNSWLPDGSGLLGMTNRWSPPEVGGYDIAVFDTADGSARPIGQGPGHDRTPFLSPDGTRVGFLRESPDGLFRLCVSPFDNVEAPECRLPGGWPLAQLLGWSGLHELVIVLDSAGARPLEVYDWRQRQSTALSGPQVYRGLLSPDRRWIVAAVRLAGFQGFRDWVIPLDRPAMARRIEHPGGVTPLTRWWEGPPDQADLIDRIEFDSARDTLMLGVATGLRVRALTAGLREMPLLGPVRWSSADTTVATIDTTGVVSPRRAGAVVLTASLAGWRAVQHRFVVMTGSTTEVLREQWADGWKRHWVTFGDPHPLVADGPDLVRGLWNHGDGSYPSFAVSRSEYTATSGLGVEVRLSTPLNRLEWQRARTGLVAGIDAGVLERADQSRAPPPGGSGEATCGAGYPGAEGGSGRARMAVAGGVSVLVDLGPRAELLQSGGWWTLRLQIFPDGRCGVAVNGVPVWVSPEALGLEAPFRLRLGDESFGTRMLHGPLVLWTGVRTDLDWSGIISPRSAPPSSRDR